MGRKKSYARAAPDPETEIEDNSRIVEPEAITASTADTTYVHTVPPIPPTGPLGDLTPDVIEWFRLYDPAEYQARYIRPGHPKGPRIRV